MAAGDFLEKVQRELSAKELEGLRAYSASTDQGSVTFFPIIKRMGQEIRWTGRVHIKGASGPLPVSKASLKAIGAPPDWADKAKTFLKRIRAGIGRTRFLKHSRHGTGRPESIHQTLLGLGRRCGCLDQRNDFINIRECNGLTFQDVRAIARFTQIKNRAPSNDLTSVRQKGLEHLL